MRDIGLKRWRYGWGLGMLGCLRKVEDVWLKGWIYGRVG